MDENLSYQVELQVMKSCLLGHHGSIRLANDELFEAEDLLKEALECLEECRGNITLRATILYYIGLLRLKQQDFLRAESCLRQSLTVREQWFGKSHPLVADVVVSLARLLSSINNNKGSDKVQAEHLYRRAIQIREQCLGSDHLLTADILYELGCLIAEQQSHSAKTESVKLLRQALDIRTTKLGGEHADTRSVQEQLTKQEVMLRLGHYEFGKAKPTDTRTRSKPYSSLSFRDKDLTSFHRKQKDASTKNKAGDNALYAQSINRQELLRHSRPMSLISSSGSHHSASEKLLMEQDKLRLLHRDSSVEQRFKDALDLEDNPTFSESENPVPASHTRMPAKRYLRVDLNFAGNHGDKGQILGALEPGVHEPELDNYAQEFEVSYRKPKKAVKSRLCTRPVSAPLKLFKRYSSAGSERIPLSQKSSSVRLEKSFVSASVTSSFYLSSSRTNCSFQSHQSRCDIPGPHSIHVSNSKSPMGPHSSLQSLLDVPSGPRDMKRAVHHKSAWYHVPGRYSLPDQQYPAKRSQQRPSSVVSTVSRNSKKRGYVSHSDHVVAIRNSAAKFLMPGPSDSILNEVNPSEQTFTRGEGIEGDISMGSMVTFKEAVVVG